MLGLTGVVSKQLVTLQFIILMGYCSVTSNYRPGFDYHTRPKSDLAIEGYCMYKRFEKVVKFEVNERARGVDHEQQQYRALQITARDGNSNSEDWNVLLLR